MRNFDTAKYLAGGFTIKLSSSAIGFWLLYELSTEGDKSRELLAQMLLLVFAVSFVSRLGFDNYLISSVRNNEISLPHVKGFFLYFISIGGLFGFFIGYLFDLDIFFMSNALVFQNILVYFSIFLIGQKKVRGALICRFPFLLLSVYIFNFQFDPFANYFIFFSNAIFLFFVFHQIKLVSLDRFFGFMKTNSVVSGYTALSVFNQNLVPITLSLSGIESAVFSLIYQRVCAFAQNICDLLFLMSPQIVKNYQASFAIFSVLFFGIMSAGILFNLYLSLICLLGLIVCDHLTRIALIVAMRYRYLFVQSLFLCCFSLIGILFADFFTMIVLYGGAILCIVVSRCKLS